MKRFFDKRLVFGLAVTAASSCLAPSASAQTVEFGGYALSQHEGSPAGDAFFGLPSPWTPGHLDLRGVLAFDYAYRPLRLGSSGPAIVGGQGIMRVGASLSLIDRLSVSLDLPIAVAQSGDDPVVGATTIRSPTSAEVGDLRAGARVSLLGDYYAPIQLGLGSYLFVPTAPADAYLGDGSVRVQPYLSFGGRSKVALPLVYTAVVGPRVSTSENPQTLTYGLGVAAELGERRVRIGPEFYGSTRLEDKTPLSNATIQVDDGASTNAEFLIGSTIRVVDGLTIGGAAGPGLSSAIGTPTFRGVIRLEWSPEPLEQSPQVPDADEDGISDAQDACPQVAGVSHEDPRKNGCPPPDRDGDGVWDTLDACLEVPGTASGDPLLSGCPLDRDGDGVIDNADACVDVQGIKSPDSERNGCPAPLDPDGDGVLAAADACPKVAGQRTEDPATNGCPADSNRDRDGDGVANHVDACPDEPGASNPDPKLNGCPNVHVTEGEIVIAKQIRFVFGKSGITDTIDPVSDELLNDVRDILEKHPDILRVQIQGHTDNVGGAFGNSALSQARANSVMKWLVDRGVPPNKLTAKGYGASQPLGDNSTEEGRQKNRRVQFVILQRK